MTNPTVPSGNYACECCKLPYPIQRPVSRNIEDRMHQPNTIPKRCARCAPHRKPSDWEAAAAINHDHALWYWDLAQEKEAQRRAANGQYEQLRVQSEAQIEEARERMIGAFRSRDSYIRALARISEHHQPTGRGGCSCRRRDCDTLQIIEQPWIRRRINAVERAEGYGEDSRDGEDGVVDTA